MTEEYVQMTPNGYAQLQQEIQNLKKTRPAKIKALQHARSLGDLSENAEYSAAKRDLRHLESRLRYLDKQSRLAKVVKPTSSTMVEIGSTVDVEFLDDGFRATYQVVGAHESNLATQKLSFKSPLGAAILHHKINDISTVEAPEDNYAVKILTIHPAK
ncbi:transcription elongation factor GreA [Pediococcus claussenii]|uniref:Transcription elongation factor GreA n=1 Tax=Pediococcus claussenii (strain ATCC BAA-344 / DSM 14800 / JCM 18046 / KCTC 3811 / LMG 21948 / P06) TaxID=701521 RepID=G8PCF1_PEDCP|nr:transcription elongation factor GreA [Pediococcus claussenii]AEV94936.1 transcription elongation factor, GreA/GreB, C-term family protein [Pediococcus claussenii ATCC BAA-344]ANZ70128.1 transcription elongation factor GreA [Pediococcus claussenii]ANZ71943.1 transcription elongation factor GreA [Pediococcus claussenii]KRN19261.1 hypothetical protein IV79_GL001633 [Pediococcus claussenii]